MPACDSRFISDTMHSCARSEVTEVQMHEVDLLFECILIRDGQAALPCWFPRSDVQTIVNYNAPCEVLFVCFFCFFCFCFFSLSFCAFLHFFVYLGTIYITRNTFCGTWYLPHSHVHN